MPYIIDGNNLIGHAPDISLKDPEARRKLVEIVRRFQLSKRCQVIIVFDGEPDGISNYRTVTSKFSVLYPRYGLTADEEIQKILEGYVQFNDVTVVTSDRELKDFAKHKGAATINSVDFHEELKKYHHIYSRKEKAQERINTHLSKQEVDQWMKIFGE